MSVPVTRGSKVKGQSTEYCVEVTVANRTTRTWLRYSELRDLSQRLKSVKGYLFERSRTLKYSISSILVHLVLESIFFQTKEIALQRLNVLKLDGAL